MGNEMQSPEFSLTTSDAELYEPTTGIWIHAGQLSTKRVDATATLLLDGRVLVAGGHDPSAALSSAEIFDPVTRTWSTTGSMRHARWGHSATLLPNGKVLVVGGESGTHWNGRILADAELYDPTTGTWSDAGSMSQPGGWPAVLLANGTVLIVFGSGPCEIYDPSTNSWSETGALNQDRAYGFSATRLDGGKVLVAGGVSPIQDVPLNTAEVYDSARGVWSIVAPMTTVRSSHSATLLPNGTVLVDGGLDQSYKQIASAEFYSPNTNQWASTGSLNHARAFQSAVLLQTGQVLVVGGEGQAKVPGTQVTKSGWLRSAELYGNPS